MSFPGMTAPAGAGGIRQWLSTAVVSAVALVLTLVVMSLSVGPSLPGASLHVYLTTGAYDGSKNGTAADFLLSEGDQEPLPEQNATSGTMYSGEASLDTREFNRKMPEPVATGDTATTAKLDEGTTLDMSKSSSDFQISKGCSS